jgi:hypothetical protein
MQNGIHEDEKPTDRINSLLDGIKLYLDKENYTFDYARVEQLLTEAEQVVEQTARGVKPVDLPTDIPFSDSLDEEGRSDPYSYAGDMSPEKYDKLVEHYEKDRQRTNNVSDLLAEDDPRVITVYQAPDRRHCDLCQIENNGVFNDTGMPGIRYFLPDGFHVLYRYGHMSSINDYKGHDAYLIDSDTGRPQLCTIDPKTGRIPAVGILLRVYAESPAKLWDEYNTMLRTIDSNYRLGRIGLNHNGGLIKLAITDCNKIIDNLYKSYVQNPGDKNLRDELAAKHEQLKWLEKESHSPAQTKQNILSNTEPLQQSNLSSPTEELENVDGCESAADEIFEQGMTI